MHLIHTYLEWKVPLKRTINAFITYLFFLTIEGAGISQCFIKFWLKLLWYLIVRSSPTKDVFCFSHRSYWEVFHLYFLHQIYFLSGFVYIVKVLFFKYNHCDSILLVCDISSTNHFASSLEHCQCFPREDVFPIFALRSVRGNTVPRALVLRTLPRAQGLC